MTLMSTTPDTFRKLSTAEAGAASSSSLRSQTVAHRQQVRPKERPPGAAIATCRSSVHDVIGLGACNDAMCSMCRQATRA